MLAAGLNVGLGHDAAECNNSLDMFEVMKFASLMHRAARVDASLQQAPDVLGMATRNGAAALGHETGQLAAGTRPTSPWSTRATSYSRRWRRVTPSSCTRTWSSRRTAARSTRRSWTAGC
jgi:hypothetical protein